MANPLSETPIEIGGKRYRFVLGFYALCSLERRMGMPWSKLIEKYGEGALSLELTLALFHAGLSRHHDMTERDAADLLEAYGLGRAGELLANAMSAAMPAMMGGQGDANPPTAAPPNGNGSALSPTG